MNSTKRDLNDNDKQYIIKHLDKIDEYNSDIRECANHQNVVTSDVLDYSRLETGHVELKNEIFNPRDIVNSVSTMLKVEMAKKGLKLIVQAPFEEVMVKGDSYRIKQVLLNLLTNAVKFTHKGNVTVSFDTEAQSNNKISLTMSVQDTGIGLNPEEQERLFKRFTQANLTVTHQYGGSGLGLAISNKIVTLMGGKIQVESQKKYGSKFWFSVTCDVATEAEIAAATHLAEEIPEEPVPNRVLTHKKILIVEDNVTNQKILSRFLVGLHQFSIANNGVEALKACEEDAFDLIFMDIEMPEMGGLEATQRIREREQALGLFQIPIIATSGNAREEHKNEALRAGMNDYITKPFSRLKIENMVLKWANVKIEAQMQSAMPAASTIKPFGFYANPPIQANVPSEIAPRADISTSQALRPPKN